MNAGFSFNFITDDDADGGQSSTAHIRIETKQHSHSQPREEQRAALSQTAQQVKQHDADDNDNAYRGDGGGDDHRFRWHPISESMLAQHFNEAKKIRCAAIPLRQRTDGSGNDPPHTTTLFTIDESTSSAALDFPNSDLVSGTYEGGLKVWECSLDLCRYIEASPGTIRGQVLELGCGHGLPGCMILKRAYDGSKGMQGSSVATNVTFSDFNSFVIDEVTLPNIVLNIRDGSIQDSDVAESISWIAQHAALSSGHWTSLSNHLLSMTRDGSYHPPCVPRNGLYDVILAAETTYSIEAAGDTASMIVKHLVVSSGVAYVAHKRYYFGVGGGSDAFQTALQNDARRHDMTASVQILEVYDDGASNIREILGVKLQKATEH